MPQSVDWPRIGRSQPRRRPFVLILIVLAVIFFGGRTALSYYVDVLWFRSLGYGDVFWKTLNLHWEIFTAFAAATFLILYGSFLALKRAHVPDLPDGHTIIIGGQPLKLPENGLHRQFQRLSTDNDRVTIRQVGHVCSLQSEKRSVQNEKCGRCKSRKDFPVKIQCFPKDVPIAERPEPEHVHVVRQCGPATEEDHGQYDENENERAAARLRPAYPRPVNGLGHCSPLYLSTVFRYSHNTPSAFRRCLMASPSAHRCTSDALSLSKRVFTSTGDLFRHR